MRVWLFSAVIISLLLSQVALADITIDKEVYKPGEIVHIELYYPHEIDNVELSNYSKKFNEVMVFIFYNNLSCITNR